MPITVSVINLRRPQPDHDRLVFQSLNHTNHKMSKFTLWSNILADIMSYDGWPDCYLEHNTLKPPATSAKTISVRAEWLHQSGRAPAEQSETPRWQITPHPETVPRVALHIALQSQFCRFFSLCLYPIVYNPSLIIWHALFNYLYIYTYGKSGDRW